MFPLISVSPPCTTPCCHQPRNIFSKYSLTSSLSCIFCINICQKKFFRNRETVLWSQCQLLNKTSSYYKELKARKQTNKKCAFHRPCCFLPLKKSPFSNLTASELVREGALSLSKSSACSVEQPNVFDHKWIQTLHLISHL